MHDVTPRMEVSSAQGHSSSWRGQAEGPPHRRAVRSAATRVLHLLLLLMVLHQLIGSEFMEFPFPGDPPSWTFQLHEYVGLGSIAVVTAFWVWAVLRRGETRLSRLVPWFSLVRSREVWRDLATQIRRIARGWPPHDDGVALASATHGLGLLAVTAMVVTGAGFFFTEGTQAAHVLLRLHKAIANLVWIYLIAHAGIGALHHLLGSDVYSRMFWGGAATGKRTRSDDFGGRT